MTKLISFFFLLLVTFWGNLYAQNQDLGLQTKTLKLVTDGHELNFELHATPKNFKSLIEVEEIIKGEEFSNILRYFAYYPLSTTHIILDDRPLAANGSATVFPQNTIRLYLYPPVSRSHLTGGADYLKRLVLHELVHIIHMDRTTGILKTARSIFGSIAKFGGVVPRWFTEGVATWAESHFTYGGRLRNELLEWELQSKITDEDFCQSIDCLNEPLGYPHGSYAYWSGAYFLDWLEKKEPGTIRCLIKENSSKLPFFLNVVFRACRGKSATELFLEFQRELKEKIKKRSVGELPKGLKSFEITNPILQKDFHLLRNKFFWMEGQYLGQRLKSFDLVNKTYTTKKPKVFVEYINKPSPISINKKELLLSSTTYLKSFSQKKVQSLSLDGDIESLEPELEGEFPMSLSQGRTLYFRFEKGRWSAYVSKLDAKEKLITLGPQEELFHPFVMLWNKREYLFFQTTKNNKGKRTYELNYLPLTEKPVIKTVVKRYRPFELLGQCQGKVFIKNFDQKSLDLYRFFGEKKVAMKRYQKPWVQDLVALRMNHFNTVMLLKNRPRKVFYHKNGCRDFGKKLWDESSKLYLVHPQDAESPEVVESDSLKTKSYPSLSHFIPRWWFFEYISGDTLSTVSLVTSINDPNNRHQASLRLNYYPEISEFTPTGSYLYSRAGYEFGLGYDRNFVRSSLRDSADEQEIQYANFGYRFFPGILSWKPYLFGKHRLTNDYISTRDQNIYGVGASFSLSPMQRDDFFQGLVGQAELYQVSPQTGDAFSGREFVSEFTLLPLNRLSLNFRGAYTYHDTNSLSQGVIFSGGNTDFDSYSTHPFYGISNNGALGTEAKSGRIQAAWDFYRAHSGYELFPLFLRNLSLLAGADYLETDFIYISEEKQFLRNQDVTSTHIGLRSSGTMIYYIPIEIDVIYSQLPVPSGNTYDDLLVLFKGRVSF